VASLLDLRFEGLKCSSEVLEPVEHIFVVSVDRGSACDFNMDMFETSKAECNKTDYVPVMGCAFVNAMHKVSMQHVHKVIIDVHSTPPVPRLV
jgi:hypothetical protein